jgi:hypothetical protein
MMEKPFVVACIPTYEDERTIGTVIDRVGNCVDGIESAVLGVELMKILVNLRDALKGGFARRMESTVHYGPRNLWVRQLSGEVGLRVNGPRTSA